MKISRRSLIQGLAMLAACPATAQKGASSDQGSSTSLSDLSKVEHELRAPGITPGLSKQGQILSLKLGAKQVEIQFHAGTVLIDCIPKETTASSLLPSGAIEFRRGYVHQQSRDECTVVERFSPAPNSIRWEIEILGTGAPWSTPIQTQLTWPQVAGAKFWTAWDHAPGSGSAWRDPLVPSPFAELNLRYGGYITEANAFSLPLATILDESADVGLSLVQSPESSLLDMQLNTTARGDVTLSRINHRISLSTPIKFAMDLVPHPADWRAALGWMVNRYPDYFDPPNPNVQKLDGCGAYASYQGELDRDKLRKMAFSVNWNAHFDFPFHGMMIPPVARDVVWNSWYQKPASLAQMSRYDSQMKRDGFHVLEYFVLTECGNYIQKDPPPRKAHSDDEVWRDANDFIYYAIPSAVLHAPDGKIQYSNWFDNVVVDPAEPVWRDFLIGQIRRLVKELPDSDGICIDRMDWLTLYNSRRDDGMSWVDGRPARSLLVSWKQTGSTVAKLLHDAGKFVYANPLVRRLDASQFLDGFYDEYADDPNMLNLCAFLAVRKPAIGWTRDLGTLRPNPDALFQRHLHLGVFPTVPYPEADHSIAPDEWAERYYLDYGPLLSEIRGKRWVLEPHAIAVENHTACVNLFQVWDGYAAPITFAQDAEAVTVILRNLQPAKAESFSMRAILPATAERIALNGTWTGKELRVRVPVKRGCALLKVNVEGSNNGLRH